MSANTIDRVTYPLPQTLFLKIVARFLSYVFHPIFIPAYVAAYLIFLHPYAFAVFNEKQKFIRLLSVFVVTAFFPAVTVFLLWRLKFADSIFLRTQKERIIPYVASIIYFFWAFYVNKNLEGTPESLISFLLGIFLSASAALMANNYFKISMHSLGICGAAAFLIILGIHSQQAMGPVIGIATLVAGMVCTARFVVSNHTPLEVYAGLFIGIVSQVVASMIIM